MTTTTTRFLALASAVLLMGCGARALCPDGTDGPCEESSSPDASDGQSGGTCEPGFEDCGAGCVDLDISADHCGACGNPCEDGFGCAGGECVPACTAPEISCGGSCTDPDTDADFCGATGSCVGVEAGTDCDEDQICSGGACVPAVRYLGSLGPSDGRWNFGAALGLAGAIDACQAAYGAGAGVCSHDQLLDAQGRGELGGVVDGGGATITSFWLYEAGNGNPSEQCVNTAGENQVWTYQTAHLGHQGRIVNLDNAAGTLASPALGACNETRHVPCCQQ